MFSRPRLLVVMFCLLAVAAPNLPAQIGGGDDGCKEWECTNEGVLGTECSQIVFGSTGNSAISCKVVCSRMPGAPPNSCWCTYSGECYMI